MEDIFMIIGIVAVLNFFGFFDRNEQSKEKVKEAILAAPFYQNRPWQDGWQQRLAERAKEVEPVLRAKEETARAYRAQIKSVIPKEKQDAQYMPEELKKHLGLV